MKEKWIKKWQNLSFLSKIAHLSVIMLALFAPFVSLVVEGLFNIYIVEPNHIFKFFYLTLVLCVIAREWKLLIGTFTTFYVVFILLVWYGFVFG